ncbi:hypothetical protein [Anatilimnocola floriformis]|uniref:hypothetical protein n=1 Tax=Anatilimnocola floriformis TaxID=2948575 RepID=UPI0020C33D49|nr:hypothetical protein [Anatilimnocola floriformis]
MSDQLGKTKLNWSKLSEFAKQIAPFFVITATSTTIYHNLLQPVLARTTAATVVYAISAGIAFAPIPIYIAFILFRRWDLIGSRHVIPIMLGLAMCNYHVAQETNSMIAFRRNVAALATAMHEVAPTAPETEHFVAAVQRSLQGPNAPTPGRQVNLLILANIFLVGSGFCATLAGLAYVCGDELRALYALRLVEASPPSANPGQATEHADVVHSNPGLVSPTV